LLFFWGVFLDNHDGKAAHRVRKLIERSVESVLWTEGPAMEKALSALTARQIEILHAMRAEGVSVEDISEALAISRQAAQKHLACLLQDSLVEPGPCERTSGRPRQLYVLTPEGRELFPRQYAWFLELLVGALKADMGSASVTIMLQNLARQLAQSECAHITAKPARERLAAIAHFMSQLGYEASAKKKDEITATNCVYHHLAQVHPEVCAFDIALLESLTGGRIAHAECIVRGGKVCRFKVSG
jgi:DeoR family transcriptional regulator, suf operon transcriptional repressor